MSKKHRRYNNISFIMYEKSIKIEGISHVFYLGRTPTEEDCKIISEVALLGRNQLRNDFLTMFNHLMREE